MSGDDAEGRKVLGKVLRREKGNVNDGGGGGDW